NTTGTLNRVTISNTTIGLNSTLKGDNGIYIEANSGGAVVKATVDNCIMTGSRGDAIDMIAQQNCTTGGIITNNTITNTHTNSLGGGVIVHRGGTTTYNVSSNTITGAKATQIVVSKNAQSGVANVT